MRNSEVDLPHRNRDDEPGCEPSLQIVTKEGLPTLFIGTGNVVIHIGDAPLYAALRTVGKDRKTALVVDPETQLPHEVIAALKGNRPLNGFQGRDADYYTLNHVGDGSLWHKYQTDWSDVNVGGIFYYPDTIQSFLKAVREQNMRLIHSVDEMTLYYPDRRFPLIPVFLAAGQVLKRQGCLIIRTELDDMARKIDLILRLIGLQAQVHYHSRTDGEPYVSAYDIAVGDQDYYELRVTGRQVKQALSSLGKIRKWVLSILERLDW